MDNPDSSPINIQSPEELTSSSSDSDDSDIDSKHTIHIQSTTDVTNTEDTSADEAVQNTEKAADSTESTTATILNANLKFDQSESSIVGISTESEEPAELNNSNQPANNFGIINNTDDSDIDSKHIVQQIQSTTDVTNTEDTSADEAAQNTEKAADITESTTATTLNSNLKFDQNQSLIVGISTESEEPAELNNSNQPANNFGIIMDNNDDSDIDSKHIVQQIQSTTDVINTEDTSADEAVKNTDKAADNTESTTATTSNANLKFDQGESSTVGISNESEAPEPNNTNQPDTTFGIINKNDDGVDSNENSNDSDTSSGIFKTDTSVEGLDIKVSTSLSHLLQSTEDKELEAKILAELQELDELEKAEISRESFVPTTIMDDDDNLIDEGDLDQLLLEEDTDILDDELADKSHELDGKKGSIEELNELGAGLLLDATSTTTKKEEKTPTFIFTHYKTPDNEEYLELQTPITPIFPSSLVPPFVQEGGPTESQFVYDQQQPHQEPFMKIKLPPEEDQRVVGESLKYSSSTTSFPSLNEGDESPFEIISLPMEKNINEMLNAEESANSFIFPEPTTNQEDFSEDDFEKVTEQPEESTMPVTDHIEQAVDIEQEESNKPTENEEKSQEITENLTVEEAATSENTEDHLHEKDTAEVDIEKSATEDAEVMMEKTIASLSKTEQEEEGVIPEKKSSIDKMADDESNVASQEAEVEKDIAVEQEVVKEIEEEVIPTPPPSLQEDEPEKVNEDAAPSTPPPAEEPAASDAGESKTEFPTVLEDDVVAEEKLEKKRVSQQYVENIQDLDVVAMQDQPSLQERRDSKTREKQIRFEEIDIATKELLDEPPQEALPKERKPRSKEREIVDEEPAVGAEEGEVSELPTKRRSKVDRSYTERKPSVTDISFHDEQPTLRERRESKDLERKIRIRKIERKLTEELDSIPVSPTRKGSSSTRTVTSSTTTEEYSPPSRAKRSDVSGDSKIPDYSPPPRRTAGGTSSGSGSSKIRRARSFKSPAEVPYYSLRDKRPESYFSMENYYPGKFSSTPRVDTKTMNSSQKYVDDFNLNYGSGASAASPKYKPDEYSSTSLTPTTDLIKSLSTDRSPISHSSLYATDLNRYDYNYGDVNYRPSSSFVNLSPYSSPSSLYPKARNLNDSLYSYNDYRYYPYHRSYYDYSIPYYSANYHTPSSSYVRSAVDSGIDSRSSPSSFYTPRSLYTPLSFYNDLAKVRSAYKKADRIATNAENALYDRSQTVSPLLSPSPYYNNRYKSPSNGAGYTFYPYAGSPIFSPSFGV